jgi:hypothetical protein
VRDAPTDAASDEPSTYQSPTDIIDASTVHNLDPAVYFVDASALDLNFDEPSTYNGDDIGGGGGGVESGTGIVRHASV